MAQANRVKQYVKIKQILCLLKLPIFVGRKSHFTIASVYLQTRVFVYGQKRRVDAERKRRIQRRNFVFY
jgi:hypothetical protein